MTHRAKRRIRIGRDTVLFTTGLVLTVNEALRSGAERPTLLLLFAAMMGLPAILARDEHHPPPPPPTPPAVEAKRDAVGDDV